jgi:hypothetical protein
MESMGWLREHPLLLPGISAALVLSLGGVCCGFGVLAAPWLACELSAQQLGAGLGKPPRRRVAWIGAALFQLFGVLAISFAAWLAVLGLGADMPITGASSHADGGDVPTVVMAVIGGLLALLFMLPFLYTPLILIDRGGTLAGAVLESARLVARGGVWAHLGFSLLSHCVQLAPVLVGVAAAGILAEGGEVPWGVLLTVPFVTLTIPLGQGMIASVYLAHREQSVDPRTVRAEGRPPASIAVVLSLLALLPAVTLALVGGSLLEPSRPGRATSPIAGEVIADIPLAGEDSRRRSVFPPDTGLEIAVEGSLVWVEASDGGGAGRLPLPSDAPLQHVRIIGTGEVYAVEMTSEDVVYVTWIDPAGVRVDDHLRARFVERVPGLRLVLLAVVMAVTPLLLLGALVPLSEIRRRCARGEEVGDLRADALRRAWWAAAALLPFALAALWVGIAAVAS